MAPWRDTVGCTGDRTSAVKLSANKKMKKGPKIIKQVYYPKMEIDNSEKDIVQIWQNGKQDSNVIQVEREKLNELIAYLKSIQ